MRRTCVRGVGIAAGAVVAAAATAQELAWRSEPAFWSYGSYTTAYWPERGVVVTVDADRNLWEWDGLQWTRSAAGQPAVSGPIVLDPLRNVLVAPGYGSAWEFDPNPYAQWYEYDGVGWSETRTPLGPVPRSGASAAFDPILGGVVMFGGVYRFRNSPSGYSILHDEWLLDGGVWRRLDTTSQVAERASAGLAFDSSRHVMVLAGGYSDNFFRRETWERRGTGAYELRASEAPDSLLRLRDDPPRGVTGDGTQGGASVRWTWDGRGWTATPTSTFVATGYSAAFAADAQRGVEVAFGGWRQVGSLDWMHAPRLWERRGDGPWEVRLGEVRPMARLAAGMAYDEARHAAVLFGGFTGSSRDGNGQYITEPATWTLNERGWTRLDVPGPAQRMTFGMCYDARRGVTVVYGGRLTPTNSTELDDTWEWDGAAWSQRAVSGPGLRLRTTMAFDRRRGKTVLFGGYHGSTALGDTWEYDGAAWTRVNIPGPGARYRHTMAFDEARGVLVLFGGVTTAGVALGDTWEYDGAAWTQRSAGGPAPRAGHVMEYNPVRHAVTLCGGGWGAVYSQDCWTWNGEAWTPEADLAPPGARAFQAWAFDRDRGQLLVFGGSASASSVLTIGPPKSDLWRLAPAFHAPVVDVQPADVAVQRGAPAVLTIAAHGDGEVRYQWRAGVERRWIPGATGPTLTIPEATLADAGRYDCLLTGVGPIDSRRAASRPAVLTVCIADFDGDGAVDERDYAAYMGAYETGDPGADVNADGFLDFFDHDSFVEHLESGC